MHKCSVIKKLRIVAGNNDDYKRLSRFHYRDSKLGPYVAIFAMRVQGSGSSCVKTAGVIVYTMPSVGAELRNAAMGNLFSGLDRSTRLGLVNKNIRCISRVIIEPRFRGLGLASSLVRKTMGKLGVPVIEAMAVMGMVNPFFEKAGMTAYTAEISARSVQLIEALSMVDIEQAELISASKVQEKLECLPRDKAGFIDLQIRSFLLSYGKRRHMSPGLERTKFVLGKLTFRPVYYVWFNSEERLKV